ncbi:MAG: hypothetical protein JXB23_05170 [Candidatus Aminicenantes bacterium]|nr:hypothetical protein [Candidatus Aminicenantes bacterium]
MGDEEQLTAVQGSALELAPFQGRILPDYHTPSFLDAIKDCSALLQDPACKILEESRNRVGMIRVSLGDGGTLDVVIKEFRTRGLDKLKSGFQKSKARKAWLGSTALHGAGLETARPVAYLEKRGPVFLQQSFFLAEHISGAREIRFLFRELPPDALEPLVRELAAYLSQCRWLGILHRDLSDGNILVKKDGDGRYRFFLLDTNRIRLKRKIGPVRGIKNVIRLGLPREFRRSFLAWYLRSPRAGGWQWLWYRMSKSGYTGFVAFKRALKLKTIVRKLKIQ